MDQQGPRADPLGGGGGLQKRISNP